MSRLPEIIAFFKEAFYNISKMRPKDLPPLELDKKFLMRLLALFGDLCLSSFLYYYALSFSKFGSFERALFNLLGIDLEGSFFGPFLMALIVMQIFRFYTTLLFGLSPFQYWAGFYTQGVWWEKRLLGAGKVFIDLLLGWSLVPNYPLLWGRPSYPELWTRLDLRLRVIPKKQEQSFYIGLPLFFLATFFSPLLYNLDLINGFTLTKEESRKSSIKNSSDFSAYRTFSSDRFKFSVFSSLKDNRFIFLPQFEITKLKGKKRKITPYISIYDKIGKRLGHWKIKGRLPMLKLLRTAREGNPFFNRYYRELNLRMKEDVKNNRLRKFDKTEGNRPILSEVERKQIFSLIESSLELGTHNLWRHILKWGPFLRGYVRTRQVLMGLLRPGADIEVDLIKMGNMNFLRFNQSFDKQISFHKQELETWIPMGTPNALVIEFGWDEDLRSALARKAFRESFLSQAEWFFDYYHFFRVPANSEQMTSTMVIDLITKKKLPRKYKESLEEFLFQFYYENARYSVDKKDDILANILQTNLLRLESLLNVRNEQELNSFSQSFIEQVSEITRSLKARDQFYFNL